MTPFQEGGGCWALREWQYAQRSPAVGYLGKKNMACGLGRQRRDKSLVATIILLVSLIAESVDGSVLPEIPTALCAGTRVQLVLKPALALGDSIARDKVLMASLSGTICVSWTIAQASVTPPRSRPARTPDLGASPEAEWNFWLAFLGILLIVAVLLSIMPIYNRYRKWKRSRELRARSASAGARRRTKPASRTDN